MAKRKTTRRQAWNKGRKSSDLRDRYLSSRVSHAAYSVLCAVAEYEGQRPSAIIRLAVLHYLSTHPYARERRNVHNAGQSSRSSTKLPPDDVCASALCAVPGVTDGKRAHANIRS